MKKIFVMLSFVMFFATSFHKSEIQPKQNSTVPLKTLPQLSVTNGEKSSKTNNAIDAEEIYASINFESINKLNSEVFNKAFLGFNNLKKAGKLDENAHILSICDFSLSSTHKRLWVIDLNEKKVLFNSLVAHGKNTGEEFAQKFSNTESSYQSSLG
ncbi:MAG TPA: murein L,D-transpeptidase catalytic domain family protein, partial [Kaistella sp.]|nr:murein L,D-transpeptidase catalytic domain family protein [Kaistella sp.]